MSQWKSAIRIWWFALTIVLSAFLVFQVQPVVSKIILPWFGGTPAVWTTCVLFFQLVLFAGYAYAHLLTRYFSAVWQGVIHISLMGLALLSLPISPDESWKPVGNESPTWRILFLLLMNVGLPYFLLSTTGPLLQAWFSRSCQGRSPYRLYALSNIGSLLALLSYPFFFEPLFSTGRQDALWSAGFSAFAVACTILAAQMWRFGPVPPNSESNRSLAVGTAPDEEPDFVQKTSWLVLPAIASMTLLATTNHVCQDVAVVPFLWVVPLALYLLTFIICFDKEAWYSRRWMGGAALISILLQCFLLVDDALTKLLAFNDINFPISRYTNSLLLDASTYLATMFFVCMVCHGELVRNKPEVDQLTKFYLLCGAGGAVGGAFVAIVCPLLFATYFEMQLAVMIGVVIAAAVLWLDASDSYLAKRIGWQRVLRVAAIVLCFVVMRVQMASVLHGSLETVRNFYGVLRVDDFADKDGKTIARKLVHGTTVHGFQFFMPGMKQLATTYYSEKSGVGISIKHFQQLGNVRIGVVGLGCGTLATYGHKGDYFRFYEINPVVCDIARKHFTYLDESAAKVDVILGDARLSLERETPQHFDVLVLDAFSSDAIPAHLLTREAFEVYLSHMHPAGVIAVHTSNRHLKLPPVVARLGRYHGMSDGFVCNSDDPLTHTLSSQWMLLSRNKEFMTHNTIGPSLQLLHPNLAAVPLWTDQFNNLFQILKLK